MTEPSRAVPGRREAGEARVPRLQPGALEQVSDRDFARFQALIQREAGIWLAPVKKALLTGRLARRLRELGITSYAEYYERAVASEAELIRLLDAICTNETHFFREPRHFELLSGTLLPAWREEADAGRRPRRIRAWSAACSTGEEPYSIAMSLLAAVEGWQLEILATDLSTRVLARAEAALWPIQKAAEIPRPFLEAYMLKGYGSQEGLMKAGPEIRAPVRFSRLNLTRPAPPGMGRFDLVFCRNVLIYFDRDTRAKVVERLLEHLAPGGYLFLGHSESLNGITTQARAVMPTVYVHAASPAPAGARRASAP